MPRTKPPASQLKTAKLASSLTLVLLCGLSSNHLAACEEPDFAVDLPDGKTASEAEMTAVQTVIKNLVDSGEAYVACLENDGSLSNHLRNRYRESTIDAMRNIAARFNRQLRHFRKR